MATQTAQFIPDEFVLATKLYTPPPRPDLISRPHLVAKLQASFQQSLTVFCAPAGFGKSTLLSEWIYHQSAPVVWLSLDESDNEPAQFMRYFIAAIQTRYPEFGLEVVALLLHMPPTLHLVISSRADPPLPLARLRVQGQLCELRVTDLRFTRHEISSFFQRREAAPFSPEQLMVLEQRTEGWPAGLQLAALLWQWDWSETFADYGSRLLAAFPQSQPSQETVATETIPPPNDILSERELEIMRLVADGLTAPQMATKLIISIHTMRTHLKNIYRKLEVNSRVQAVEKVRTLGLL